MNTSAFGNWLREHRKARRLSQEALGRVIGADRTYISKLETGAIGMADPPLRQRLHDEFGTSEDDLVSLGLLRVVQVPGLPPSYIPDSRKPSPAADMGDVARITDLVQQMPDEAVQHLRRFLEAMRDA